MMISELVQIGYALKPMGDDQKAKCGDVCHVQTVQHIATLILIDGLGHGPKAAKIAESALDYIQQRLDLWPIEKIVQEASKQFQGTRGFVLAICTLDFQSMILSHCGVGNITVKLISGKNIESILGARGVVGSTHQKPRLQNKSMQFGSQLIMHSDGVPSHLTLNQVLPDSHLSAQENADYILAQFARNYDDASVIFASW